MRVDRIALMNTDLFTISRIEHKMIDKIVAVAIYYRKVVFIRSVSKAK